MNTIEHLQSQIFTNFVIDEARQRLELTKLQLEELREEVQQAVYQQLIKRRKG
jgi:hypothetical protein